MTSSIEKRQIKISAPCSKVEALASSHPFTQQVDIIFPARCIELEDALSRFCLTNAKGRVDLARVYAAGSEFQRQDTSDTSREDPESPILALSLDSNNQSRDVWCIDTRGVLTACVDKETYEKLGLVGRKLAFKHRNDERYVISLPLHKNDEGTRSRIRRILESWDTEFVSGIHIGDGPSIRQGPGLKVSSKGVWNVVYCSTDPDINHDDALERWTSQIPVIDPMMYKVECEKKYIKDVWIPNPSSISSKPNHSQKDESEDWENDISALYEWIGMAGLHAERLSANDRVDPYIALYEPPANSRVGDIVHLRWTGFLPPKFVQSMIDTTSMYLQRAMKQPTQPSSADDGMFAAIVVHSVTNSPVVYLPSQSHKRSGSRSVASSSVSISESPAHLPRNDGEDTWCLIMTPPMGNAGVRCILVESVGQWDARWG